MLNFVPIRGVVSLILEEGVALRAEVSNKNCQKKYLRFNVLPFLITEVKAISKSCINVVVAISDRWFLAED